MRPPKPIVILEFRPREFPWIAKRQPVFGIFELAPILDPLAEQAVIVADAVAIGRDRKCRHAFHETGGEPAESAIPERRIRFEFAQLLKIHPEFGERGTGWLDHLHIGECIDQQTADQKFEAEIIDPLAVRSLGFVIRGDPALDDPVAHGQRCRDKPIARARGDDALANFVGEFVDDGIPDRRDIRCEFSCRLRLTVTLFSTAEVSISNSIAADLLRSRKDCRTRQAAPGTIARDLLNRSVPRVPRQPRISRALSQRSGDRRISFA